jgi:NDP-sugar pyrophosphorylase family protein
MRVVIRQAVILAGGEGVRLRPFTYNIPKPMVLVNNRPFLEYLINMLRNNGITEVVLLLGYLPQKITRHFGDGSGFGLNIKYSLGKVSDKTGTRLRNAGPLLDDNFLLMYGDNYWPLDLKELVEVYTRQGTQALATIYTNKDGTGEYGWENNTHIDDRGYILRYDKSRKAPDLNGVDIGFFILNRKVLELMPDNDFSFEEEILPELVNRRQLSGYKTDQRYYYITTPESLKKAERTLKSIKRA